MSLLRRPAGQGEEAGEGRVKPYGRRQKVRHKTPGHGGWCSVCLPGDPPVKARERRRGAREAQEQIPDTPKEGE